MANDILTPENISGTVAAEAELTGSVSPEQGVISGTVSPQEAVSGTVSPQESLDGDISAGQSMTGHIYVPEALRVLADYEILENKPQIESVELVGDKSFEDLGLNGISNSEIENLFQ